MTNNQCQIYPVDGPNKYVRCTQSIDPDVGRGKICIDCAKTAHGQQFISFDDGLFLQLDSTKVPFAPPSMSQMPLFDFTDMISSTPLPPQFSQFQLPPFLPPLTSASTPFPPFPLDQQRSQYTISNLEDLDGTCAGCTLLCTDRGSDTIVIIPAIDDSQLLEYLEEYLLEFEDASLPDIEDEILGYLQQRKCVPLPRHRYQCELIVEVDSEMMRCGRPADNRIGQGRICRRCAGTTDGKLYLDPIIIPYKIHTFYSDEGRSYRSCSILYVRKWEETVVVVPAIEDEELFDYLEDYCMWTNDDYNVERKIAHYLYKQKARST